MFSAGDEDLSLSDYLWLTRIPTLKYLFEQEEKNGVKICNVVVAQRKENSFRVMSSFRASEAQGD